MRNGGYFTLGLMVVIGGLIGSFMLHESLAALVLIGVMMLVHWSTISQNWKCDKCGRIFEIDFFQNLLGLNGGVNFKLLYCPECKQRRWCKGVPKETKKYKST